MKWTLKNPYQPSLIVVIRENKNAHAWGEIAQALKIFSTPYEKGESILLKF